MGDLRWDQRWTRGRAPEVGSAQRAEEPEPRRDVKTSVAVIRSPPLLPVGPRGSRRAMTLASEAGGRNGSARILRPLGVLITDEGTDARRGEQARQAPVARAGDHEARLRGVPARGRAAHGPVAAGTPADRRARARRGGRAA